MVSLTAEGMRQLVRLRGIVKRLEDAFFNPLDDDERKALHATLQRVTANVSGRPAMPPS